MPCSRFSEEFVDDTLSVMQRALDASLPEKLATLADSSSEKWQKDLARQTILHYIGNLVVVAFAGLEHVIVPERLEDYRKLMLQLDTFRPQLKKHQFQLPPQIEHAIELVKHPQLDH